MVLVFAESPRGQFKKAAFEAVTYGKKTAALLGTECVALTLGPVKDAGDLGRYGAARVINIADASLEHFDSQAYSATIASAAAPRLPPRSAAAGRPQDPDRGREPWG